MSDPEAPAGITEKPTPATHYPVQLASADPGRHGSCTSDQGVSVQRGSPRVEHGEQVVLEDNMADAERSEPGHDLLSKGKGFLTGHRYQCHRRLFGASQGCCRPLSSEPYGVGGLGDACCRRIPAASAAVAVCAPRKVERDSAGAGATRIDSQKDLFQFGLISCGRRG
jgi:hypothetical protein